MREIYNTDCFSCIEKTVSEVSNPIIVTDPPFNVGYGYDEYVDRLPEEEYLEKLDYIFSLCPSVVIHYPEHLYKLSVKMGKIPMRVISWVYNSNTPRQHRDIAYFGIEPDFHGLGEYKNPTDKRIAERISEGKKPIGYDWVYADQVKNVSKGVNSHPCQMPLAVMLYVVRTLPHDCTIIDPFMGSGTTCLAAKRNGMEYVGIEISKRYFKIAYNRLNNDSPLFDTIEGNEK